MTLGTITNQVRHRFGVEVKRGNEFLLLPEFFGVTGEEGLGLVRALIADGFDLFLQMLRQRNTVHALENLADGLVRQLVAFEVQGAPVENGVAFPLGFQQSCLVHHLQMMTHARLAHLEEMAQLQYTEGVPTQHPQNLQAQRVTARFEDRCQGVHGGQVSCRCGHGCHGKEV